MNKNNERDRASDDLLPDLAELPEIDLGDVAGGRLERPPLGRNYPPRPPWLPPQPGPRPLPPRFPF
jgi:hypothetical protein